MPGKLQFAVSLICSFISGKISSCFERLTKVKYDLHITGSPIKLLHSINQYCVMNKRDLFAMNEMDLKFNKIVSFFLSVANF